MTELIVEGGYFDVQINGGWGHHFSDDPSSIWDVGARLVECGVTRFLPTLISSGFARVSEATEILAAGPPDGYIGATPVGWHLEGPWFNVDRAGAHDRTVIRPSTAEQREPLSAAAGIRLVTLAPEIDGGLDAIADLTSRGITVSLGHSNATVAEARAGLEAGAAMGTHLFNAMSGLHHRTPGLAAVLLDDPRATPSLIADGHHVSREMMRLAWRLAADRLVLVSDAVSLMGERDLPVARLADGTIAGATVGLNIGVQTLADAAHCAIADVVECASGRPASVLGLPPRTGDRTILDGEGNVVRTEIAGQVVYEG